MIYGSSNFKLLKRFTTSKNLLLQRNYRTPSLLTQSAGRWIFIGALFFVAVGCARESALAKARGIAKSDADRAKSSARAQDESRKSGRASLKLGTDLLFTARRITQSQKSASGFRFP